MVARQESSDTQSATRAERRAARARRIDCAPDADQPRATTPSHPSPPRDEPRREDAHTIRTRRRS